MTDFISAWWYPFAVLIFLFGVRVGFMMHNAESVLESHTDDELVRFMRRRRLLKRLQNEFDRAVHTELSSRYPDLFPKQEGSHD